MLLPPVGGGAPVGMDDLHCQWAASACAPVECMETGLVGTFRLNVDGAVHSISSGKALAPTDACRPPSCPPDAWLFLDDMLDSGGRLAHTVEGANALVQNVVFSQQSRVGFICCILFCPALDSR